MNLFGIKFKRVMNASGARNFFGEGWPHHRWLRPNWEGSSFVAKTTTVEPRKGNMPLKGTMPIEYYPKCIRVNFFKKTVLNAVGLSGPGLAYLLGTNLWQTRTSPFLLSFMAVEKEFSIRKSKAGFFATLLADQRKRFNSPFGIEVNFSCPNVGMPQDTLIKECREILFEISNFLPGVPLVPKFNVLISQLIAQEIATHPACAAITISNTIPFGKASVFVQWPEVSPLAEFGGGGLSGAPLLPLVAGWIKRATNENFPVPIIGCGGILSLKDAEFMFENGASAIQLGSIGILRPWRIQKIVRRLA